MGRPSDARRQARYDYDGCSDPMEEALKRYPRDKYARRHYIGEWKDIERRREEHDKAEAEAEHKRLSDLRNVHEILGCDITSAQRFIDAFNYLMESRG